MAIVCLGKTQTCECVEYAKFQVLGMYEHCVCGCSQGTHVDENAKSAQYHAKNKGNDVKHAQARRK